MMTITCPECGEKGDPNHFAMSLADECFCPKCDCEFMLAHDDEEDGEE